VSDSTTAPVIAGLAVGVGFVLLLIVVINQHFSSIPTVPVLTEARAIDIMKADVKERDGDDVIILLYGRDSNGPDNVNRPLLLVYYDPDKDLVYYINGTSHAISNSCIPSPACLNVHNRGIDKAVADRLAYIVDGRYSGEGKSAPAFYFIDAMSGEVVWSYIGEDVYPELGK
jgi:hypothetical protein